MVVSRSAAIRCTSVSIQSLSFIFVVTACRSLGCFARSRALRMPICPIWAVFSTEVRSSLFVFIYITGVSVCSPAAVMHRKFSGGIS